MSSLIPLQIDPSDSQRFSNITAFMNSLFNADVRASSIVTDAAGAGSLYAGFADENSRALIVRSWLAAWQHSQGDTGVPGYDSDAYHRCPSPDRDFISFVAGYIKKHGMQLAKPKLTATGQFVTVDDQELAVYSNSGYRAKPFFTNGAWNYGEVTGNDPFTSGAGAYPDDTVVNFLVWLLYGAHFVIPSEDGDQTDGNGFQGLKDAFIASSLQTRSTWTSHYVATLTDSVHWVNTSCLNYLSILTDAEPSTEPLIVSYVLGPTTDLGSNTFMQLEGWPVGGTSTGDRHGADYDTHLQTLWNISTFGACVFSEKRSTPLFLSHPAFDLTVHTDTMMPHYDGAGSHQRWMHTSLLVKG